MSHSRSGRSSGGRNDSSLVNKVVDELISRNARLDQQTINDLLAKHPKDVVDKVYEAYADEQEHIEKQGKKFARLISDKYMTRNLPLHLVLKKAKKHAQKLGLSDAAFEAFTRIYRTHLTGDNRPVQQGMRGFVTTMSKLLGGTTNETNNGVDVSDKDLPYLQNILRSYESNRMLQQQIVIQTLSYREANNKLNATALSGDFKPEKHNPQCHVDPVVAALFIPKIKILEDYMLYASFAYIMKLRKNREPILTRPNYELFYALVTDNNDVVCDVTSPIKDYNDRVELQALLWNQVLSLRNGRYYDCVSSSGFKQAIDQCSLRKADHVDLLYSTNEGAVIRRLLAAFSLKPLVVQTVDTNSLALQQNTNTQVLQAVVPSVSFLSVLTLNINHRRLIGKGGNANINEVLTMPQYYIENGMLVPRDQSIIYARQIIVVHVPRRRVANTIAQLRGHVMSFQSMPAAIQGLDYVNKDPIEFVDKKNERKLEIDKNGSFVAISNMDGNDTQMVPYQLRSVVAVETAVITGDIPSDDKTHVKDLITGCSTYILPRDGTGNYTVYAPHRANHVRMASGAVGRDRPIIDMPVGKGDRVLKAFGTIFVYVNHGGEDNKHSDGTMGTRGVMARTAP